MAFKGLDPAATYDVVFEDRVSQNTTKTGAQLMAGLSVTLSETRGSEMIWLEIP
ncbi:GH36 C-terminal domain-containing protein [Cohnella rhizosphaerae]|uniref:GH36 C-terminal domain-containing protein n=1 Tax=Cohnella rhizosphaerae TaxID=1457232 RepID=UPI003B8A7A12